MVDINKLVSKHYVNSGSLLEMIEEQLSQARERLLEDVSNEAQLETDEFAVNVYNTMLKAFRAPTEQAGKLGTSERDDFQSYIASNVEGLTLSKKILSINKILEGRMEGEPSISEIMGSLGAVKMLQQTIDDFNESTAGFLFEAFLSALLEGKQVTGGSLPIEDVRFFVDPKTGKGGQPVSLKLLAPGTKIEGSLQLLLDFFMKPEVAAVAEDRGIEYVVATKTKKDTLDLYSFNIKPSNFFYWIHEEYFDLKGYKKRKIQEATEPDPMSPEEVNFKKERWEKAFLLRAPMFGLDPSQVKFNYDWGSKGSGNWKTVVRKPSIAAATAGSVAEIMLSDEGQRAFDLWANSEFGNGPDSVQEWDGEKLTFSQLVISPEDEEAFRSDDPQRKNTAAVRIAWLGRYRRASYLNSILGTSEDFHEAPVHITRWWDHNIKGEHEYSNIVNKINALVQANDAESIIEWASLLKGLLRKGRTQFHIQPMTVRSGGTLYGTIRFNKTNILRALQRYSKILEKLVAPLYQEMDNLTNQINGYYLKNRVGDAFKASDTAKRLATHTATLSREAQKRPEK